MVKKAIGFEESYGGNRSDTEEVIIHARGNPAWYREAVRDAEIVFGKGYISEYVQGTYLADGREKRGGKGENRRGDYTEADEQYQLRNERLRVGWVWEEKMQELHERELHEKNLDQA